MNFFRNWKLFYKTFTLIVLALAMLIATSIISYNYLNKMAINSETMYKDLLKPVDSIDLIRANMRANIAWVMELAISTDLDRNKKLLDNIAQRKSDTQQRLAVIEQSKLDQTQIDLFKAFKQKYAEYSVVRDKMADLGAINKNDEAYNLWITKGESLFNDTTTVMIQLSDYSSKKAETINQENHQSAATAATVLVVSSIIAALLLILLGLAITSMITKPVKTLLGLMSKAEEGDLTVQGDYNGKDEVGQLNRSFNAMLTAFRETVNKILTASENLSAAAQQISASTEEIASGSTSQAQSAQMMNELFKELSIGINTVATSAEQASELSNRTTEIAKEGGKVVDNSIKGMDLLSQQMSRLEDDSKKIGEIIEVIDDIADQTNLLALNAAIEAARAGDQGRGFAVVADEVRKLAERSGEATKQITTIIKGMQINTFQSVKAVEDAVSSSQKTGESFETILGIINESNHKVVEIAAASEQQASQSSEVLISIESISATTEESSAASEETASAAQSLAQLAEELSNTVAVFKTR